MTADVEYDPADGMVGYLTFDQWDRLTLAWVTAMKHLSWWWVAGQIRGGDADEMRSRSSERMLPLPGTWLAAHEITRLMQELNKWPELEDAARDVHGADLATLLIRETETAAAKWPLSDRSHRVSYFRCQACQQLTLKYLPPNDHGPRDSVKVSVQARLRDGRARTNPERVATLSLVAGRTVEGERVLPRTVGLIEIADVVVRCTDKSCGAVMDSQMFELAVAVITQEQEMKNAKRRVGTGRSGSGDVQPVREDDPALGHHGPSSAV